MVTIINFLCLVGMCVYAQTGNITLFIASVIYLSLASIGCALAAFSKDKVDMEWPGWISLLLSLVISGTVVYFTFSSSIGVWYLCVCLYWYGIILSTKDSK